MSRQGKIQLCIDALDLIAGGDLLLIAVLR
jgi:hypothetical protein